MSVSTDQVVLLLLNFRLMYLNKPETLNSLTEVLAGEFATALQQLQADRAARALVITGLGDRAFSAGGDFGFIQQRMESTLEDNARVSFFVWVGSCRKWPTGCDSPNFKAHNKHP
jgi:enoyl-CoA hydratase/carnithine racemase